MGKSFWFTKTHVIRVSDFGAISTNDYNRAYMYACSSQWQDISNAKLMVSLADNRLYLVKAEGKQHLKIKASNEWGN
ncbi:hypothetical protein PCI56_08210 [Plesiomonas shigelloides subsp. oncorhynchi]|nr:hypothetical protein [Plesiomonas shigelloides]